MMNQFKKILYVLGEQINEPMPSLIRAISLAKNNQTDLTILYVLPRLSLSSHPKEADIDEEELQSKVLSRVKANLEQLISSLDKNIKLELRVGKRYMESIRAVQANKFDLVIKEADDISWLDRFIGSDDMHLLRKCPCPVWLMKKDEKAEYDNIMAAVDFDTNTEEICSNELNNTIMDLASSLSISDFASLHAVNIYDVPEKGFISLWVERPDKVEKALFEYESHLRTLQMNALFDELEQRMDKTSYNYLSPIPHIIQGIPGRDLPTVASDLKIDLVVMGTVARTGILGVVIGNTAETVLSQLQCSVLAIKPKDFISPVS